MDLAGQDQVGQNLLTGVIRLGQLVDQQDPFVRAVGAFERELLAGDNEAQVLLVLGDDRHPVVFRRHEGSVDDPERDSHLFGDLTWDFSLSTTWAAHDVEGTLDPGFVTRGNVGFQF